MSKRCSYTNEEVSLLGRLMRSEAVGEGNYGMLLVGNIVVNRVVAKCENFKKQNTIKKVIYAKNAFDGTKKKLFRAGANAKERENALKCIKYWKGNPATRALYYYAPGRGKKCKNRFYGKFVGKYKNHCFYNPDSLKKCKI